MKKSIFIVSILGVITLIPLITKAETVTDETKKATFDIVSNPEGSLLLEVQDLNFGEHTVIPDEINAITRTDSSIKITEYSGERPGWTLRVKMDKFKDVSQAALNGVQLFYPKVTPTTTMPGDNSPYTPNAKDEDTSFLNSLSGTIVYDNEQFVSIAQADVGKGFGQWILPYSETNRIQLKIPQGQRIGSYSATLTYEVVSGP